VVRERAARATDVTFTLAQIPDDQPRLLLMHHPLAFQQLPAGSAPVALVAHTHGRQIRLLTWLSLYASRH